MDLEETLRLISRILLFLCAGLSAVFCISYQVKTKGSWRDSAFGRHIMLSSAMFSIFFIVWIGGVILGPSNLIYRIAIVAAFAIFPYVQFRQLVLLFRAQNGAEEKEEVKDNGRDIS